MKKPERLLRQLTTAPPQPDVEERKERFAVLNAFISKQGGFVISVPGAVDLRFEVIPGSPVPMSSASSATRSPRSGRASGSWPMPSPRSSPPCPMAPTARSRGLERAGQAAHNHAGIATVMQVRSSGTDHPEGWHADRAVKGALPRSTPRRMLGQSRGFLQMAS